MAKPINHDAGESQERHWLNELDPIAVPNIAALPLADEFRLRYFSEALEQRKVVPRAYAARVERAAPTIRIPGFKNPWNCPPLLLASRLVQNASTMNGLTLMQPLLPLWLDRHRTLFEKSRRFLDSRDFQVDKDIYRKKPREVLEPLISAFVAECSEAKADVDVASLIMHCVVVNVILRRHDGAPRAGAVETDVAVPTDSAEVEAAAPVVTESIWSRWLDELRSMSDEHPDWEGASGFADELRSLYDSVCARRESRMLGVGRLRDGLAALVAEFSKEVGGASGSSCRPVDFFNASDLAGLDPATCTAVQIGRAVEAVHATGEALAEWEALLALPSSRSDAKARRAQLEAVEERIDEALQNVRTCFAASPLAGEGTAKLEVQSPHAEAQIPSEEAQAPPAETQIPTAEAQPPAEEVEVPAEEVEVPAEEAKPSAEEAKPSAEEAKVSSEETQPPAEEVEVPAPEVLESTVQSASIVAAKGEQANDVTTGAPAVEPEAPSRSASEKGALPRNEEGSARPAESNVAASALKSLQSQGEERQRALEGLVWDLVAEGNLALAWHVSRLSNIDGLAEFPRVAPWVLHANAIAPHVQSPGGDFARELLESFAKFEPTVFRDGSQDFNNAVRFMLAACCLRASIVAPATGAASILQTFVPREGMQHFYEYCQELGGYGVQLQPIEVGLLTRVRAGADLERERERLRGEVEAWMKRAPGFGLVYQPATIVWQAFVREDGLLGRLLRGVRNDERAARQKISEELSRLRSEGEIEREVLQTDRRPARLARLAPIGYMAIKQIRKHADEALAFVERWLDLNDGDDDVNRGYLQKIAEGLRTAVFSKHDEVLRELRVFATRGSREVAAAASCCRSALESVRLLFENGHHTAVESDPLYVLHAELLKVPGLRLSEGWALETSGEESLEHILRYLSCSPIDWQEAFEQACEARDHWTTERIVEVLSSSGQASGVADGFREIRARRMEECALALERDIETTRKEIEHAVAYGVLAESDRATAIIVIERLDMRRQRGEISRFDEAHKQLRDILEHIASKRKRQVDEARMRLVQSGISSSSPNMQRILDALQCGDVFSANEYIGMTQDGEELPTVSDHPDTFRDFFDTKFDRLDDFLTPPQMTIRHVAAIVREGRAAGPIDMKRVPGAQAKEAASLLEAWDEMKRREIADEAQVRTVLGHLGFRVQRIDRRRQSSRAWLDISADPLEDRELSPVAFFGSEAKGR